MYEADNIMQLRPAGVNSTYYLQFKTTDNVQFKQVDNVQFKPNVNALFLTPFPGALEIITYTEAKTSCMF